MNTNRNVPSFIRLFLIPPLSHFKLGNFRIGFDVGNRNLIDLSKKNGVSTLTGTSQELAKQVLTSKNIKLAENHASGVPDQASAAQNMRDAAAGRPVHRSDYENAPGQDTVINPVLLTGLLELAQTFKMDVSEFAGASHHTGSQHYSGNAMDINKINGVHVSPNHPNLKSFMAAAVASGLYPIDESGLKKGAHVHIQTRPARRRARKKKSKGLNNGL